MRIFTLFLSILYLSTCVSAAEYPIDRLDQRALPLNGVYNFTKTGSGVHMYVLDSLVRYTHQEFGGRADIAFNPCSSFEDPLNPNIFVHGTAVAGLVGSSSYGPATSAFIHSVSICPPPPTYPDGILTAINWVTTHKVDPAVAVICYDILTFSPERLNAINASIASGVTWVVSAGNGINYIGTNACTQPQLDAIVVGSLQINGNTEGLTGYTNYGSCVTLFAPLGGTTTYNSNNTATGYFDGTSASAPIVAGVVALMLEESPNASPATIKQRLIDWSTKGEISGNLPAGTPNRIAYSLDTTISGKVTKPNGQALSNATVILTDSNSVVRYATTSSFGLYYFENVIPYEDYTVAVVHHRYSFPSQIFNDVTVSLFNVDFMGLE